MAAVRPDVDLIVLQRFSPSSDNTVGNFRMLFGLESAFGIQRLSIVRGVVGPPSIISQLYSISLTCFLLYNFLPHMFSSLKTRAVTDAHSLGSLTFDIYRIFLIFMHFLVVFKTVFVESSKTVALFEILRDVDDEMNLPASHRIYKSTSLTNKRILVTVVVSYVIVGFTFTRVGFFLKEELYLISLMALFELEMLLCGILLGCIQARMRHITAHIKRHFSLQPSESKRKIYFITSSMIARDIDFETATFEIDLATVYKLYGKLINAFKIINGVFSLQVLLFFFNNFTCILMSLFGFVKISQAKSPEFEFYIASFYWWTRMAMAICYPSFCAEGVTVAVEKLQSTLIAILGDVCRREHHEAAASLLRYCELSQPRFTVYRLFCMDIQLPFNYITLVVTYLIALLQFDFI